MTKATTVKCGVYRHFKGGYYSVLGEATGLPPSRTMAVLIGQGICFHEGTGAAASLYYDGQKGGVFYLTATDSENEDLIDSEIWIVYQSLIDGKIWFRAAREFFDDKCGKQRFSMI